MLFVSQLCEILQNEMRKRFFLHPLNIKNMRLTTDEFELISEALSVFTNSINNGKGLTLINRQSGRLLNKLEKNVEGN